MVEAPPPVFRLVADQAGLAEVVSALEDEPSYAVDTEFHRERTYFPKLALLQLAWPGECVLVDPLSVDLKPFARVLDGPGTAVMHAASQDMEVLLRGCGTVPSTLFDTQVAAGFVGHSTPSLAALADRALGLHLPKASRMTDWLRRPLDPDQQLYAASDVYHLLDLADVLRARLSVRGRLGWAEEECEELRVKGFGPPDPDSAWLRIKETRQLRGAACGVAKAVAAWRERRAADLDQPVRFILPDMTIVGLATTMPRTLDQLRSIRGIDDRHARGKIGETLLAQVAVGRALPPEALAAPRPDMSREVRPAAALVAAWVGQLSRDLEIDPSLLATRSDLANLLAGDPDARLSHGWRRDLLGHPIKQLMEGEFALAFDGRGGLALEWRSHRPVELS